MKHLTEEQIWDILDGNAVPEIEKEHAVLIETDIVYKAHFDSFAALHNQLCSLDLDAPSMRFEQNLMERLQPSVKTQRTADRIPWLFAFTMVMLTGLVFIFMTKSSAPAENPNLTVLDNVNTEGFTSWLSNPILFYGFIVLNVVLFFVVLDKKVFKPFFEKKIK